MYASYFGLKHEPFSIAPDPHFLFMSERHREALAHLLYGLGGGGGFVLLTGEIGTGKTTLCRLFLEQIPANCNVAYIFNPKLTVTELLQSIGEEFHLPAPQGDTVKAHVDRLNGFLLQSHAAGRNNVLIIDEAQNLEPDVLEQLRLLTNLETRERKLLQIVLIGQPELRDMLAQPQLEQLAQRVIARYHLGALTPAETEQYIRHRMDVAGLERPFPFEPRALKRIHEISRGVPRRINLLCDRALLGAYATSRATVDRKVVDQAAQEVFGKASVQPPVRQRTALVLGLGLAAGAGLYAAATRVAQDDDAPRVVAKAPAVRAAPAPTTKASAPAAPPRLHKDVQEAWRELAALWKAPAGEGDACAELAKSQVQCFTKTLPLALVRELDRPGIVTLDAQQGTPSYALLTRLTRDSATLRAGGTEQTVTLDALAARWNGEFATLWKSPPGYAPRGEPGVQTTEWMRRLLAAAPDAPFKPQLRSFQLAHGLPADGQPGPMTYMQLNRAGGADEPRLATGP
ncbi:AAA family ATPase [Ramlibacter sp. PS4R-6]|uniref:AAA family ATPase n=1 Tax=Ramlibacter sp. PS4R-6 TaxID=3133438 RepID=UPI003097472C